MGSGAGRRPAGRPQADIGGGGVSASENIQEQARRGSLRVLRGGERRAEPAIEPAFHQAAPLASASFVAPIVSRRFWSAILSRLAIGRLTKIEMRLDIIR